MYYEFVRANRQCSEVCGKDCLRDYYETIFQGLSWPSKQATVVQPVAEERRRMHQLSHCCALVSVLYSSRMVQINQIYARTELVDFLAEVGGTISMWIGVSMLSTYTLLALLIDSIGRRSSAANTTRS